MNLLDIAHVPPVIVTSSQTVMDAIDASVPARVGAVAVVDEGRLRGIFTERDVMVKVLQRRLDPSATFIRDVMSSPVHTVRPDADVHEVLSLMLQRHIRHLPVSQDGEQVQGMLSIRNVLQHLVQHLAQNVSSLEDYISGRA